MSWSGPAHGSKPSLACVVASAPGAGSTCCAAASPRPASWESLTSTSRVSCTGSAPRSGATAPKGELATTRLVRAMQHTASPIGVFALRAHWHDFALLLRTMRNTESDRDHYLDHVDRLLGARATSISPGVTPPPRRCPTTGSFTRARRMCAPTRPDRLDGPERVNLQQVRWLEDMLIDWDAQWRAYFARCDIRPLEVFYEDLAADYQRTVERVLDYLGLASVPQLPTSRLRERTFQSDWTQHMLDEYRAARDRLAPQPTEESWSRRDQIFEVPAQRRAGRSSGPGGPAPRPRPSRRRGGLLVRRRQAALPGVPEPHLGAHIDAPGGLAPNSSSSTQ